jgi:hypothetical protein
LRGRCATRQQPPVLSILRIAQRGTAGAMSSIIAIFAQND